MADAQVRALRLRPGLHRLSTARAWRAAAAPVTHTPSHPVALVLAQGAEDPLSLPPHGTEVFIGGLPRNITEQQLRDFASEAGDVHSAKLIRDPNNPSQNRGYGFIK